MTRSRTWDAPAMMPTLSVPASIMGRRALLPLLEAATSTAERWLEDHPEAPRIYESGVRWQAEPPGQETWDPPPTVIQRRWGDCDDLAPWRAAELRREGDSEARADTYVSRIYPDGRRLWHAIVVRGDGTVEDPSARLGMRKHPGHYDDGTRFVPQASTMGGIDSHDSPGGSDMSTIHWTVTRTANGYEGTIELPFGNGGSRIAVRNQASSPGEALEGAIYCADDVCGMDDECGFINFGELIPGIVSSVADVARTISSAVSRRGPSAVPASSPEAGPMGPMMRMLAMRPGGMPFGAPGYGAPSMMPGMPMMPGSYGMPTAKPGWGPSVAMGSDGWTY